MLRGVRKSAPIHMLIAKVSAAASSQPGPDTLPGAVSVETITAGVSRPQPLSKAQQAFHSVAARQCRQAKTMVSLTVLYIIAQHGTAYSIYFSIAPKTFVSRRPAEVVLCAVCLRWSM